jgi:branched-chain amino acid transport system substrate-binding protein
MKQIKWALLAGLALCAAPWAQAASSVKIGFVTTLSGPGAVIGQEAKDGFALGLKATGNKLGGVPVELEVVDDQMSADAGRQAVERLVKRDKVDVVTGIIYSSVLLPVVPAVLNSDTIFLSLNSGPPDYAGAKCHRNFFSTALQNEDMPQAMGKYAMERKYQRVAVIAPNYPGGREILAGFKRQYRGTLVDEVYPKLGQLDFAAELAALRASKPDAIFFFLPGGMGVNFIKQFEATGMSKQVDLLTQGFSADEDTIKAVGEPLVGVHNASSWAADLPNAANEKFVAEFKKAYGRLPTLYAAQAYDTAMLLDGAVKTVGGKVEDREAFRTALRAANFTSVRGSFKFGINQYPVQNVYLRAVQKGAGGKISNKLVATLLTDHVDAFASSCSLK